MKILKEPTIGSDIDLEELEDQYTGFCNPYIMKLGDNPNVINHNGELEKYLNETICGQVYNNLFGGRDFQKQLTDEEQYDVDLDQAYEVNPNLADSWEFAQNFISVLNEGEMSFSSENTTKDINNLTYILEKSKTKREKIDKIIRLVKLRIRYMNLKNADLRGNT